MFTPVRLHSATSTSPSGQHHRLCRIVSATAAAPKTTATASVEFMSRHGCYQPAPGTAINDVVFGTARRQRCTKA